MVTRRRAPTGRRWWHRCTRVPPSRTPSGRPRKSSTPATATTPTTWRSRSASRCSRARRRRCSWAVAWARSPCRTWRRGLKKNTRAIFVETPTNPLLRVLDVEPIATLCKTEGLALLVDATFATPLNYRPLEHGADVVIHSATKYLNGHADVLAGAVAGSESVIEEVRKLLQVWG